MSYKPRHVAKLQTSSGPKKNFEDDLPLLHTPYSEVNASTTLLDTRSTLQLYFYALPNIAIPEMHNSDGITNPKPFENHLTNPGLSVGRAACPPDTPDRPLRLPDKGQTGID
jgi:hypothetical protein